MNIMLSIGLIGFIVSIILGGIFVFSDKERFYLAGAASILFACSIACTIDGLFIEGI
jgi:hypothetical protein